MKNFVAILFLGVMALALCGWWHLEHTYRYRISVPNGDYSLKYYTNAYSQRRGCVSFCQEEQRDSSQICGMYTITRLR